MIAQDYAKMAEFKPQKEVPVMGETRKLLEEQDKAICSLVDSIFKLRDALSFVLKPDVSTVSANKESSDNRPELSPLYEKIRLNNLNISATRNTVERIIELLE